MKLEIDLADREEVAAAVPLLQLILDGTAAKTCGGQCHAGEAVSALAGTMPPAVPMPLYDELKAAQAAAPLPPVAPAPSDAAAIFGGTPPAAPLAPSIPPAPAPSTVAPVPPVNTAPTTPTPGPASSGAVAGSVEFDSNGLPWDERIHSSGKTKVKDGSWRYKGGIPPERIKTVEDELRAKLGNAAPPAAPTLPASPSVVPAGANSGITTSFPPAAPAADPSTFEQIMPRITAAVTAGILPPTAISEACAAQGLASVVALQQSPAFVPLVWAFLKQQYPAVQ